MYYLLLTFKIVHTFTRIQNLNWNLKEAGYQLLGFFAKIRTIFYLNKPWQHCEG